MEGLDEQERSEVATVTRMLQIIVSALVVGVVVLAFLAWRRAPRPPEPGGLLDMIGLALAGAAVVAAWIVPGAIMAGARRRVAAGEDPMPLQGTPITTMAGKLAAAGVARTLVGCAMLEGAALFNGIVHMIHGTTANLIAMGVLFLLLLTWFPTRHGVETWVTQQQRLIRDERP